MKFPQSIENLIDDYYRTINILHADYLRNENYAYSTKLNAYKQIFEGEYILDYLSQKISECELCEIQNKKITEIFEEFKREYDDFWKKKKQVSRLEFKGKEYDLEKYAYDIKNVVKDMVKESDSWNEIEYSLANFLRNRISYVAKGYNLAILYLEIMKYLKNNS